MRDDGIKGVLVMQPIAETRYGILYRATEPITPLHSDYYMTNQEDE